MYRATTLALSIATALTLGTPAFALPAAPAPRGESAGIAAMPLNQALHEFAQREHLRMVYESSVADGVRTHGAPAGLTQQATLQALLDGTGLQFRYLDAHTVTVMRATVAPAPQLAPDDKGSTGDGGEVRTQVSDGPPVGMTVATQKGDDKVSDLQEVVVTGTRASGRTVTDSLSPIDIITPAELMNTGASDLPTALRALIPSVNFPQPAGNDMLQTTMPMQLRGQSPDATLVLINGKRQHTTAMVYTSGLSVVGRGSSPVDLSAIPMNAIQSIEVLRDGASAQYGSDAVAGVVNIILKGGRGSNGSADVKYGNYQHDESAPNGRGGNGRTWTGGVDQGFNLGNNGWFNIALNYLNQLPTNFATLDVRYPADPTYGTVTGLSGLARMRTRQAAFNGQYSLAPDLTVYSFGVFNKRNVLGSAYFRSLSQYKTMLAAVNVYPNGYLPEQNSSIRDTSLVAGLRGTTANWDWDLSADLGQSFWSLYIDNSINYSLGAQSPFNFYDGTLRIQQDEYNLDVKRDFEMGWEGPLTVAWGLAGRHEAFSISAGDASSYVGSGAQSFPGYQPLDAGRHTRSSYAGYVDLEATFTPKLSSGLAVRREHYSDFGDNTSWSLSSRYAFTPLVAMRGTISTTFRAPSLQQEYYSSTTNNFVQTATGQLIPVTVRTFPVSDPAAKALGAVPLKPETAHNVSLGLVFTPQVGPYTTVDIYQINLDDRISLSGTLSGAAVQAYLASVGLAGVGGGRFFTNAVSTRTRGADVVSTLPIKLRSSTLRLTGSFNYNHTTIRSVRANPEQLGLSGLTLPVFDRTQYGLIQDVPPRTKAIVDALWSFGRWSLGARVTRYGGWKVLGTTPAGDQSFSTHVLVDTSVSYRVDDWKFTLGGNNVANVHPEKNNTANSTPGGQLPYPSSSPFGFNGAYWYASANYRW